MPGHAQPFLLFSEGTGASLLPKGSIRVLTRDEERSLIMIVQHAQHPCPGYLDQNLAMSCLHDIARAHSVTFRQAQTIVTNARRARQLMLLYNGRLVASVAHQHAGQGVETSDLMAEGMRGAMKALERFDLSRGCKFASYAIWYIRCYIIRTVATQSRVLTLPAGVFARLRRVTAVRARLLHANGGNTQFENGIRSQGLNEAIGVELGLSAKVVASTLKAAVNTVSLDAPMFGDNMATLIESLPDESSTNLEREEPDRIIKGSLCALLWTLKPRERNILRLRYGLNSDRRVVPRTEIADAYGLSQERVRQIEHLAIKKLHKPWRRKFLKASSASAL
jgi:RNA polymerase sigma factor (sigma-70 family)